MPVLLTAPTPRPHAALRLTLALLVLTLCLMADTTPAHAQSSGYSGPTYTGGLCTDSDGGPSSPFVLNNGSYHMVYAFGYGGGADQPAAPSPHAMTLTFAASGSNAVNATFTWSNSAVPLPQSVIIEKQAEAEWSGSAGCTGSASNPLGGTDPGEGKDWNETTYSVQNSPASSLVEKIDGLSATATTPAADEGGGTIDCQASCQVSAFPVTISLSGAPTTTTGVAGGPPEALAGEQITATLTGLPPGFTVSSYSWSTSGGSPFETFNTSLPSNQQVALTAADKAAQNLKFYDIGNGDEVYVSCTAVVQPPTPAGGAAPPTLTVTAQSPQPVTFITPGFDNWIIEHGYVQSETGMMESGDVLQLAAAPLSGQASGEEWNGVSVSFPASLPQGYKSGTLGFAQLDDPTYTYSPAISNPEPNNGLWGLDTGFPIASFGFSTASGNNSPYGPEEGDSPGTQAGTATTVTANEQFVTWLVYEPPSISTASGPAIWVPIANYSWGWGGTATLTSGVWALSGLSPASAGGGGPASPSTTYPTWTLVHNG